MKNKLKTAALALISAVTLSFGQVVFYGATAITVPTSVNSVNLKQAMYRTFARDTKEGDISHLITIDGNNWTVNSFPTTVTYSVTGYSGTQQVTISRSGNNTVIERTLYTLSLANLNAIQIGDALRGDNHDKQHLGIFMPRNSSISWRWLNRSDLPELSNLMLRLFSGQRDGNLTNEAANGNTQNFQMNSAHDNAGSNTGRGGIPFIVTPKTNSSTLPRIEVTIASTSQARNLHYYHYKDDRNTFWNAWTNDKYALLGGRSAQLMMPIDDKERYGNILGGTQIDDLLAFYDNFVDMFDDFHGLKLDDANLTHRNIRSKFFFAPQYGGCCPFYGSEVAGMVAGSNDPSLVNYLRSHLTTGTGDGQANWVSLHEAGHGYDGIFSRGKEVGLVDVTNNILSSFHQSQYFNFTTSAGRQKSWLFNYNNEWGAETPLNTLDKRTKHVRTGNLGAFSTDGTTPHGEYNLRERLYALIMMYRGAGKTLAEVEKAHSAVHRLDREMLARGQNWAQGSLFAKGFADGAQTNIVPFLEAYGYASHISDITRAQAYEGSNQIAFFLDSVATDATITSVRSSENLWGGTELIKPSSSRSATGTGRINLTVDQFDRIQGKELRIKNGATVVQTIPITSQQLTTQALPIGAYFIEMPLPEGNPGEYFIGYNNLIIREGSTPTDVNLAYKKPNGAPLAGTMRIDLLRGSMGVAYSVSYDPQTQQLVIVTGSGESHWVKQNPDRRYASVEVLRNSSQRFYASRNWSTSPQGKTDRVDVNVGDIIRVYHDDTDNNHNRMHAVNTATNQRDDVNYSFPNKTNVDLVVTERGIFMLNSLQSTRESMYTSIFNSYFQGIKEAGISWGNPNGYQDIKTMLVSSSALLSSSEKSAFDTEFNALISGEFQHPIYVTHTAGGVVSRQGGAAVNSGSSAFVKDGENLTLTFTANDGFDLTNVKINGANNSAAVTAGQHTFTNVTSSASVEVTFTRISTGEPELLTVSRVRVNSWETSGGDAFVQTALYDGNPNTYWHSKWTEGAGTGSGHRGGEALVDIDLGAVYTIDRVEIDGRNGGVRDIAVARMSGHAETGDIFPNGQTMGGDPYPTTESGVSQSDIDADFAQTGWTAANVVTSGLNTPNVILTLNETVTARYIRLSIVNAPDGSGTAFAQVSEIRVFGKTDSNPDPDPDPDPNPDPNPTPIRTTNRVKQRILSDNIVSDKAEIIIEGTVNRLVVYDAIGNIVYDGVGKTWDLRNTAGREVAEGTYLLVVEVKDKNGRLRRYSARLGVKR